MDTTTFETPGPLRIVIEIPSGSVVVNAGASTDETRIDAESRRGVLEVAQVEEHDGGSTIMVRSKKQGWGSQEHDIRIQCPPSVAVDMTTGSSDLAVRGTASSIEFRAGSGDLSFDEATRDVSVKVGSGDVVGRTVGGTLSMHGASGDVRVGRVTGEVIARTASGDVEIASASGDVNLTTISGDIDLGRLHTGVANMRAVSGDITIGVAEGTSVFLDLGSTSGDARSDLNASEGPGSGDTLELHAATVSGDIRVRRARS